MQLFYITYAPTPDPIDWTHKLYIVEAMTWYDAEEKLAQQLGVPVDDLHIRTLPVELTNGIAHIDTYDISGN